MHKKTTNAIWGILLVLIGISIASKALFGWSINIFLFRGWWTMFIIIPCVMGILEKGFSTGKVIGLLFGIYLFLLNQSFIPFYFVRKLFIPCILIFLGVRIITQGKGQRKMRISHSGGSGLPNYTGVFNTRMEQYQAEPFDGCAINSIFATVDLDLTDAIITEDVIIDATSIFGGINIRVPYNVRVKVSSTPIFGSVRNKAHDPADISAPTVFVNAICMFGGVDIK